MKTCLRSLTTVAWASATTQTTARRWGRAGAQHPLTQPLLTTHLGFSGGSELSPRTKSPLVAPPPPRSASWPGVLLGRKALLFQLTGSLHGGPAPAALTGPPLAGQLEGAWGALCPRIASQKDLSPSRCHLTRSPCQLGPHRLLSASCLHPETLLFCSLSCLFSSSLSLCFRSPSLKNMSAVGHVLGASGRLGGEPAGVARVLRHP